MQEQKKIDKGFSYEYFLSSMFQHQGYLTRRGIPLQYGTSNQDATDIDVLGITFTTPFKKRFIICDCKNKAKSKPHERVFWAKGLGQFVGASETYVSLPRCSWEFNKFASNGGIRILTSDIVEQYSQNHIAYGLADVSFYYDFFVQIDNVVKTDKSANDLLRLTRKLYLKEDPYVVINAAIEILKDQVWKKMLIGQKNIEKFNFGRYLCCELTVLIGIQLLEICSDVLGLPKAAREVQIIEKLTYGDLEPRKVKKILGAAEDLANEVIKSSVPAHLLPTMKIVDFGKIPCPDYSYGILGLVERAYSNPEWYITLPQTLDYLLFEVGLKGIEFNDKQYRSIFKSDYADERLKTARNILSFVKENTGVNWSILWPKTTKTIKEDMTKETIEKLSADTVNNESEAKIGQSKLLLESD